MKTIALLFALLLPTLVSAGAYEDMEEAMIRGDSGTAINLIKRCLLYTSPSPRDRTRSRMPSSA